MTGSDGKIYGVPYTDNTWFMYYDKSTFSEDDIKSLDTMVSKAAVAFPLNDSWYIGGFYDGLTLFGEDGTDPDAGHGVPEGRRRHHQVPGRPCRQPELPQQRRQLRPVRDAGRHRQGLLLRLLVRCRRQGSPRRQHGRRPAADLHRERYTEADEVLRRHQGRRLQPERQEPEAAAQFAAYLGSTESQKLHYTVRNIIPTDKTLTDLTADDPVAIGQTDTMANTAILQSGLAGMADWWDPAKAFGDAILNKEVTADNAQAKTDAWVEQVGSYAK